MSIKTTSKILLQILVIFLFISTISCEKEIDVELQENEPKLVVEGVIETDQFAYVTLSTSSPYFAEVDKNTFRNMFVTDALVIVSDGIISDTLVFDTVPSYPPFRFQGNKIKGQANTTYSLKIEYKNEIYTSSTQILTPIPLDSVKYQYRGGSDSLGLIRLYANDPGNEINYYKVFSMDNNIDPTKELPIWVHPNHSVTDDRFFNGKLVESSMYKGKNPMKTQEYYNDHSEDWWAFKMGDDVTLKLTQIDHESYIFWRTTEQVITTSDNPFAAPTTVQTNIQPNALGSWCGYASSTKRVVITEDLLIP